MFNLLGAQHKGSQTDPNSCFETDRLTLRVLYLLRKLPVGTRLHQRVEVSVPIPHQGGSRQWCSRDEQGLSPVLLVPEPTSTPPMPGCCWSQPDSLKQPKHTSVTLESHQGKYAC